MSIVGVASRCTGRERGVLDGEAGIGGWFVCMLALVVWFGQNPIQVENDC